jgi:hypothetical protein
VYSERRFGILTCVLLISDDGDRTSTRRQGGKGSAASFDAPCHQEGSGVRSVGSGLGSVRSGATSFFHRKFTGSPLAAHRLGRAG